MSIKITNQKPSILYDTPFDILPDIKPDVDPTTYQDSINQHFQSRYIDPIFIPINANQPVNIADGKNQIDKDTLSQAIDHVWYSDVLDVTLQDQLSDIYRQSLQYHAPNDWYFDEQLGVEALTKAKLPIPTSSGSGKSVTYTASVDVIPAAKGLLAQNDDLHASQWFANMAAYTHARPFKNITLVTIQSATAFDEFKELLSNYVTAWQANHTIDTKTIQFLNNFYKIDISNELSSTIFLPNGGTAHALEHNEFSFTRMLMYALSQFEKTNQYNAFSVQPLNIKNVYMPENIMFINLENYAHAKASQIKKDWDDLEKAMMIKKSLNYVSAKSLMTAKAMTRSTSGNRSTSAMSKAQAVERAKIQPLRGKPYPAQDLLKIMAYIIKSQITTKTTENTYKTTKRSYMRANRRDPDNINLPGKLTTTRYRPDIHIYLDTSGSISEDMFRDAIMNLIKLTRRIDCNLYFTSFSHFVSQTTLLKTKGKSSNQIYKEFLKVPKASGGTDFENVWTKIDMLDANNTKNGKSHQINFIITDFGYSISSDKRFQSERASTKHTYYVPISADKGFWKEIKRWATDFALQVGKAGDPSIRSRMLM